MKTQENKKPKKYLGIIYIGMGGCTWLIGDDIGEVAVEVAKMCKQDWKHLFKFKKKHVHPVNIYDFTNLEGWYAGLDMVVKDKETDKPLKHLKTVYAVS